MATVVMSISKTDGAVYLGRMLGGLLARPSATPLSHRSKDRFPLFAAAARHISQARLYTLERERTGRFRRPHRAACATSPRGR